MSNIIKNPVKFFILDYAVGKVIAVFEEAQQGYSGLIVYYDYYNMLNCSKYYISKDMISSDTERFDFTKDITIAKAAAGYKN